jgi:mono/diheme cytochrome c family protein
MLVRSITIVIAIVLEGGVAARAADPAAVEFFEKRIRPILVENCVGCHGPEKHKAGLRLDSASAAMKGGDSGPAIVAGEPDKSRLVDAVGYRNVDLQMPPKGKLTNANIADLSEWVRRGAAWPAEPVAKASAAGEFDLAARKAAHWAWKPVRAVPPPAVRDEHWPRGPIDRFVLAGLEARNLQPAPAADRRTLLRRATFDLTGLPPTAAEIDAYLHDESPDAFARVVDRLLASPRFGERWGRHWLDLVRYAETRGHEFDYTSPNAWQYRDYVIRAVNADVPYAQFVTEHIAGDLLDHPRSHPVEGFNESILGTGFWYFGEQLHSPVDLRQDEAERLDNMVDVFSKAVLGLTVSCARCHDHKFDAISTKDYYSLIGFLESTSYRQVRFDTLDEHRRIADDLRVLRKRHEPAIRRAIVAALRPGVEHLAESLTEAKAPWAAAIKAAMKDPADPLYAWAYTAEKPGSFGARIEGIRGRLAAGDPAHEGESLGTGDVAFAWIPDGPGFETVGRGAIIFGTDWRHVVLGVSERPVVNFDTAWSSLSIGGGCEEEPGDLAKMHRAGRTTRTPSFTISSDHLYYLARGRGRAFVCVNSHLMMEGPLHRALVQSVDGEGGFRWIGHDVSRYRGHRCHVEFSANSGAEFAIATVRQSDRPPAVPNPLNSLLGRPIVGVSTPAELAAAYQRVCLRALDCLAGSETAEPLDQPGLLRLADWLVRHSDLFAGEFKVDAVDKFVAEQSQVLSRIHRESRLAPAMLDDSGVDEHVFIRGNPNAPGDLAPRRFLEALAGPDPLDPPHGSGRLELARQVTDPELDPFISRVMVNRAWHHLFGRGLVASTDNFGVLGDPPTHPVLLDHLAAQFVRDGWSLKRLVRSIMLSAAYRMESRLQGKFEDADPQNLLVRRQNVRRLEGEAIRDAMLAVSGRLDDTMYGPPVPAHVTAFQEGRGKPTTNGPLDGDGRRSIYLAVRRNFLSPFLLAFDTPAPATCIGRRTVSNVPAQALILLNDPFVHQQAERWGRRALQEPAASGVDAMFVDAIGRPPSEMERRECLAFLTKQDAATAWADLAHVLFNLKEFIFVR